MQKNQIRVTLAAASDVPEILQVHREAFIAGYANSQVSTEDLTLLCKTRREEIEERWRHRVNADEFVVLVARLSNIVGVASLRQPDYITAMYVRPQLWGNGVGTMLLRALVNTPWWGPVPAVFQLQVVTGTPGERWWHSQGFRDSGRREGLEELSPVNGRPFGVLRELVGPCLADT